MRSGWPRLPFTTLTHALRDTCRAHTLKHINISRTLWEVGDGSLMKKETNGMCVRLILPLSELHSTVLQAGANWKPGLRTRIRQVGTRILRHGRREPIDRSHDREHAKELTLRSVFVAWGRSIEREKVRIAERHSFFQPLAYFATWHITDSETQLAFR